MEARIRVLRGNNDTIANSVERLEAGQPLYNKDKNYLTVGSLDSSNNKKLVNIQPISTRNVKGWYSDNTVISEINSSEDFYYFGSNGNKTLLKGVTELDVNVGSTNYINLKSNKITINKNVDVTAANILPTGTTKTTLGSDNNRFTNVYSTNGDIETLTSTNIYSTNIGTSANRISNIYANTATVDSLVDSNLVGNYIDIGPSSSNLDIKIGSNGNDNTLSIKGTDMSNYHTYLRLTSSYNDSDYALLDYNRTNLIMQGYKSGSQMNDFICRIYGTLEVNAINLITT